MDLKLYYDDDASMSPILAKKVAVIGYGSQGHAHALNLKESGVDVVVGLAEGSQSVAKARDAGLVVMETAEAANHADIIMMLVPDEVCAKMYEEKVAPGLTSGKQLAVAHGFNFHFDKIVPPDDVGVFMVAPKGPGHTVRREYVQGSGVPCLIAVAQEFGGTRELALSYAKAIGGTKAGVFETTFREETETDLFGEQTVLCGGLTALIKSGFETLVDGGYHPVMAYFECLHEVKLITDLIFEGGIANMRYSISNTAEYGDYETGSKIIGPEVKDKMRAALRDIQDGRFADNWLKEVHESGSKNFLKRRTDEADHQIEDVGAQLRSKIKFSNGPRLVDKEKN
tara:strand:- start:982 stop:2004 length:1023 start_codon:yes stop_codon:yes gene_type:complete